MKWNLLRLLEDTRLESNIIYIPIDFIPYMQSILKLQISICIYKQYALLLILLVFKAYNSQVIENDLFFQ